MTNDTRTEVEQVKPAEVEQVKQQADVKQALKQTSTVKPEETPKAETKDKLVLTTHVIILIVLGGLRYLLQLSFFGFAAKHPNLVQLLQGLDLAAIAIVLTLAIAKIGDVYLIGRIESSVARYNLRRVAKLALSLLVMFFVISAVIHNWYTTVAALSLFSLIIGLAVQAPVTSFLGCIYILW